MKHRATTKIEVEITYEYDDAHFSYIDEDYARYSALDMAIRPTRSVEDGVKLIQVRNEENNYYWMINN